MVKCTQPAFGRPKISQQKDKPTTPIKDKLDYRRHRGACPFYRENWSLESEPNSPGGQVLYQIICLMDTPPVTAEEQHMCLHSPTRCWRLEAAARRNGKNGHAAADAEQAEEGEPEAEGASQAS